MYKQALAQLYKYDNTETELVCHLMGKAFYKKGIYKAEYFKSAVYTKFEQVELLIPINTNQYLAERFGDFMKLPPEDSIFEAKHAEKWSPVEDFSKFVNPARSFAEEWKLI